MNSILLFFDFYSGDIVENPEWVKDVSMAFITAILSGVVIVFGINYEKKKEKQKNEDDLRFLLYNLHIHLLQVIEGSSPIPEEYNQFIKEISQSRLDSSISHRPRRQITEINRILKMDHERLLHSFLVTFKDKTKATVYFNLVLTCIDYLNRVLEKIQYEYEDSMEIRFKEMQKFSNTLLEIERELDRLALVLNIDITTLTKIVSEISSSNIADYYNQFVLPTEKLLLQYKGNVQILVIMDHIKMTKESIKEIILRTEELEDMLKRNVPEISKMVDKITEVNSKIRKELVTFIVIPEKKNNINTNKN